MINTEIFSSFPDKSRVLIHAKTPSIAQCLVHILDFHQKEFDYIFADETARITHSDFIILENSDPVVATVFQPNIAFISTESAADELSVILDYIVPGGVLVYPESLQKIIENSEKFFRKLPFDESSFIVTKGNYQLRTEMGNIPVSFNDEILLKNLTGLKLISQQFGILEEDYYEPLLSF